jgi:hypothetical protein
MNHFDLNLYIRRLNMEETGIYYIINLSIIYFMLSYAYINHYHVNIDCKYSILAIIILNTFSVLSYIVYCRHIHDEATANKLGGHMILTPIYVLVFYGLFLGARCFNRV